MLLADYIVDKPWVVSKTWRNLVKLIYFLTIVFNVYNLLWAIVFIGEGHYFGATIMFLCFVYLYSDIEKVSMDYRVVKCIDMLPFGKRKLSYSEWELFTSDGFY